MKRIIIFFYSAFIISNLLIAQTAEEPSAGDGSVGDPYQIATWQNLYWLSQNPGAWSSSFIQTANIDFASADPAINTWDSNKRFTPIGNSSSPFQGTYNGQGYKISNLYIYRVVDNIGLFGYLSNASISNLGLTNIVIQGGGYVGGLAGQNLNSTINKCFSTGSVTGEYTVGGFVGRNNGATASITGCYFSGTVIGISNQIVGGFVGHSLGGAIIEKCFSAGSVVGNQLVGGFVGLGSAIIKNCYSRSSATTTGTNAGGFVGYSTTSGTYQNCYSTGSVNWSGGGFSSTSQGTYSNNFFDTESSGQASGYGAVAKTTAEMTTEALNLPNFYTTAGWDFIGESTNGSDDIWDIGNGVNDGYPYFVWYNPGKTPEGDGSAGNPYQIAAWQNLYWLSQNTSAWSSSFIQTANIDFASADPAINTWDSNQGFTPIGNDSSPFEGTYNGQGYTINNLYINRSSDEYVGFFGALGDASISNLGLTNIGITGNQSVGGLTGYASLTTTTISNCYTTGSVSGDLYTGGLVGYNAGAITQCYSTCTVTISSMGGGLVGVNWGSGGAITKCYFSGNVTSTSGYAGGIVGSNGGGTLIEKCFTTGSVTGADRVGGLIASSEATTVNNCYSRSSVTNTGSYTGGFVGYADGGTYQYCYATGNVTGTGTGFAGTTTNSPTFTSNYFDATTTGKSTGTGATSKTTAEMTTDALTSPNIYTTTGWDFLGESANGSNDIWNIGNGRNNGYPYFVWQYPSDFPALFVEQPSGDGSTGNPYQIANWKNLCWLSQNSSAWSSSFVQTADIDFGSLNPAINTWDNNQGFTPIGNGSSKFQGKYNGQTHTITNLYINRTSTNCIGLFGYTSSCEISNLGLEGAVVNGLDYTGGLIGVNENSSITNCFCKGVITSSGSKVGGLIGYNIESASPISQCYSDVNVTGNVSVGGLIGHTTSSSYQQITKCFSLGSVTGISQVGGLIGYNQSNLVNNSYSKSAVTRSSGTSEDIGCFIGQGTDMAMVYQYNYSTGNVVYSGTTNPTNKGFLGGTPMAGTVPNFFDSETSGQTIGKFATAKTTAEMKTSSTFTDAGWDTEIWRIDPGINDGYPYHSWQNIGGSPLPVELTAFTAEVVGKNIKLHWQTATEINNYGFEIQRKNPSNLPSLESLSRDIGRMSEGQRWVLLDFVPGNGNSNSPKSYEFIDSDPPAGKLQYRLKQIDTDGKYEYYGTIAEVDFNITGLQEQEVLPTEYSLSQNYPNPFNPSTTIKYDIPTVETLHATSLQNISLKIYDMLGREVATLVNEEQQPGYYEVQFEGSRLASGIYLYKLQAGSYSSTKKLMLLK